MHRMGYPAYQHRTPGAGGWRVVDGRKGDAMTTYQPSNPVAGASLGSADAWIAYYRDRGALRPAELADYLRTIYEFAPNANLGAHKLITQAHHETAGFTSYWWRERLNPVGIGITGDAAQDAASRTFETGREAALAHMVRVALYVFGRVPDALLPYAHVNPRPVPVAIYGKRTTLESFGHSDWRAYPTWAADDQYGEKWARTLNALAHVFADTPPAGDGTGGTRPGGTAMKAHQVPGLSRPVYMPADMPVSIDIVPSRITNVRSNTKRSAAVVTRYTDHETANSAPGATARMHRNWLHSGAGGSYVGFNAVSDDRELIVLTPYDEVTWAAGTPDGNRTSDHHERCVNAGINHTRAREISAAWAAGVIHARGLTVQGALVQHNIWFGKNCPAILRRDGLWPSYVNMVAAAYGRIVAHVNGNDGPTEIGKGDAVATTAALNLREGFGIDYPVLVTLDAGAAARIVNGPQTSDGYTWWQVETGAHTGWVAQDWLQVTEKAAEPENGWPYPEPIVPAWWDDLTTGGKPYIEDAGMRWYRTNVLYRVTKATKRQQLAVGDDRVVGPNLTPGTTFRGAASGQSAIDGKSYTITPGLTRVDLDALEVVQEADEAAPDAA